MKVLITGANGVLGRQCVSTLLSAGHQVTAFDIPKARKRAVRQHHERLSWKFGDIRQEEDWLGLIPGQEAIIHFASMLPPTTEEHPEQAFQVNVEATKNLLSAAQATQEKPLFVYPSSVSIYGKSKSTRPMTIDDPIHAEDAYTSHKITCEEMVRQSGLPWSILRIGVALAPSLSQANSGAIQTLFHISPEQPLEYIHPKDVAVAVINLLNREEAWQKILLLGGGASCQIDHGTLLRASLNGALGIEPLPADIFGEEPYYTHHLDTSESQALLTFQNHTFTDHCHGLKVNCSWLRKCVWPFRGMVRWWLISQSPYGPRKINLS